MAATQKTLPTDVDVRVFLKEKSTSNKSLEDLEQLMHWMQKVSGYSARMWGNAIVGYGAYSYEYASKHAGTAPLLAFSPRKNAISLYVFTGLPAHEPLLTGLGKFTRGKACLQIKQVADIDLAVLEKISKTTLQYLKEKYPEKPTLK